jgi:nucleoside-diphosphate-sugar epimerase
VKILITGGKGYIAQSLYKALKSEFDVTLISRQDLDLTQSFETLKYFSNKYFDVVIHCAVSGGSRLKVDTWEEMDNNLKMYYNLLNCESRFGQLIHFGSGAEINFSESPYGMSKKVIANSILEKENFNNIRIFAVFDENELDRRFIKSNIKRYINKEPIIIHKDKYMDFFYMKDLVTVVKFIIFNPNVKLFECCYMEKTKLSDIGNIINNLSDYKVPVKIQDSEIDLEYTGKFFKYNLETVGLTKGIEETYKKILDEYKN